MFKKIKNVINMKKNMRLAKDQLSTLIRHNAKMHEHFLEGYGEGVCDYFEEKEKYIGPHFETQIRLWCVFLENKFDVFLQDVLHESVGWDQLGNNLGYLYFHVDELIAR